MDRIFTQDRVDEYMRRGMSYNHAWKAVELEDLDTFISDRREIHEMMELSNSKPAPKPQPKKLGKFAGRSSAAEIGCNK